MPVPAYRIEWNREHTSLLSMPRVTQVKSYSVHKTWEAAVSHLREEYEEHKREPQSKLAVPDRGWQQPVRIFPVEVLDERRLAKELMAQESVRLGRDNYKLSDTFSVDEFGDLDDEICGLKLIGKPVELDMERPQEWPAHPPEQGLGTHARRPFSITKAVSAIMNFYSQPII